MTENATTTSIPDHISFGFPFEDRAKTAKLFTQVHGTKLLEVKDDSSLKALRRSPLEADGVWTRGQGLEIYCFTADCVPMLFFSSDPREPIAAVHSGWRGTAAGIANHAMAALSVPPERLHVIIGPSIATCCFEVKADFVEHFVASDRRAERFITSRESRTFFDLQQYIVQCQLEHLPEANIHMDQMVCTYCGSGELPSFRRSGRVDPRIRAWIRKL